jgi:hypothetical protein
MHLTLGVLIIGSLYWRNDGRQRWRKCRLDKDHKWLVKVPISYGRRSRNGTYTMVFGNPSEVPLGQALVVQCERAVTSTSDLIIEAEWLWSAEESTNAKEAVPRFCACSPERRVSPSAGDWGCVALLGNPNREIPRQLLDEWANRVAKEAHYNANKRRLVDPQGMLQIDWPSLSSDGGPVPTDLLLATSNDREATSPTVQEIADAWNQNPRVDYFSNNRKHRIETFQDEEIEKLLPKNRVA